MRSNILSVISIVFSMLWVTTSYAEDEVLPSLLPLEKAINLAVKHPRVKLSPDDNSKYVHQQPLYLNCHSFLYSNLSNSDTQRHVAIRHLVSPLNLQQFQILQSYLDVHLSDLAFMADNEAMSLAYIQYDRAKNRMELKQLSEVFVAEKEASYQEILQRFQASGASQRLTRTVLAQELGLLDYIPRDVVPMSTWKMPKEAPMVKSILQSIEKNNAWLNDYKNDLDKSEQMLLDLQLRQLVIELLQQLEMLNTVKKRFEIAENYQDLNLERSRTYYEQEVKADLGNAMAKQTRVRFQQQQVAYCANLTWSQLNILQAKPILTAPPNIKDAE